MSLKPIQSQDTGTPGLSQRPDPEQTGVSELHWNRYREVTTEQVKEKAESPDVNLGSSEIE